jgi:polyphosphate kinase
LKNGGLYLVVPLWPRDELDPVFTAEPRHGLVEIPSEHLPRFVNVHRDATHRHVMFLDDVIRVNLNEIFPLHDTGEAYAIKMTRDAQLYIEDEYTGDLVDVIRKALAKRDTGSPTRFLYDQRLPYPIATRLKQRLGLDEEDLVPGGFYHSFSDFFGFPSFDRLDLQFERRPALSHVNLPRTASILESVRQADRLLHFPYQAFDPVLRFLAEAATDPEVTSLSATLYRAASDSQVVTGLINAARAGKRVRVFVEIKARFDEKPNLDLAQRMEQAGIDVVYSHPGLKVHCKLLLVESGLTTYAYLATGNLNEKTANVYCDHGMFTTDVRITSEVMRVFELLSDPDVDMTFDHLLVAPGSMARRFKRLVEREMKRARAGEGARMILKMNSLQDRKMIELLYRASQAGVKVRLIIRGICCLVPGIPGVSENIVVTSIVGRYLEHARVYLFHNGGEDAIYLASADWMTRNLKRRIEVAWPVLDESLKRELLDLLDFQHADNTKARIIDAEQRNDFVRRDGRPTVDAQADTYGYLERMTSP